MMGSAYATLISYSLVAASTYFFAQRYYPIAVEPVRVMKIFLSAVIVFFMSTFIKFPNLAVSFGSKACLLAVFAGILYVSGFFHQDELDRLKLVFANKGKATDR